VVNLLRVVSIVLVLAAVALALVPLVVIFDLAGGGDGLGMCPGGLDRCRNPYTAAPEMAMLLTVGLLVVLGGLRVTQRALRRAQRRRREA
jgi:hypothetical protein